jgi:hypothetical protein
MENLLIEPKTARISLPKISDKTAAQVGKGWYWDPYTQSYMPDWEVVVTPDGSGTTDYDYSDWYNEWGNDYYDTDYGNGSGYVDTANESYDSSDLEVGYEAVDELAQDLENGEVITLQHNSATDAVLTSTSLALTAKSLSSTIIETLKANMGAIGTIGRVAGGLGVGLGTIQFVLGATDGEVSAADWCTLGATALGATALGISMFANAPVWLTIGTIAGIGSITLGVYSTVAPGDSNTSPDYP